MARKTKEQLIEEIKKNLLRQKLSINDLAEKLSSNWATVRDVLLFMEKLDLVELADKSSKIKVYRLKNRCEKPKKRKDTFFGVPISDAEERLLHYLFSRIRKLFFEKSKRNPKETEVQKISVDVGKVCELKFPRGWYLFGMLTVMKYDDNQVYPEQKISYDTKKIDSAIISSVEECKKFKYVKDLAKNQYKKYNNKLYLIKEELKKIGDGRLDLNIQENKKVIQKLLTSFLFYLPTKDDAAEIVEIGTKYVNVMNKLLLCTNINLNENKSYLLDAFEAIWRYVATYNFFDSICESGNYDRKKIFVDYFENSLIDRKETALEHIAYLKQFCDGEEEIPKFKFKKGVGIIRRSYEDMAMDIK